VIADNGGDKIGNPCTLIDRTTGTIWWLNGQLAMIEASLED
jgi:hypothetical protein